MTTFPDRQLTSPSRSGRLWSVAGGLAAILTGVVSATPPLEEIIAVGVPSEAVFGVAWHGGGETVGREPGVVALDSWTDFILATVDGTVVPVASAWRNACRITDQLVPERGARLHACDADGDRWIQIVHWRDPIAIERGLQRLGTRAMGRGRFRLPAAGIDVVVREDWLVLGPPGSSWIESAHARLATRPELSGLRGEDAEGGISLLLRHASPISGVTRMQVRPEGVRQAGIDLDGDYAASPLPIRPASVMEGHAVDSLAGRFALVARESGVGLLDPRLVEFAARFPLAVPPPELRRAFAPNRLVVLDAETVEVPEAGLVEVPVIAVAVPLRRVREGDEPLVDPANIVFSIDDWVRRGAGEICRSWDPDHDDEIAIARQGGIRHLSLGSGFLEATAGHPMALIGRLAWVSRLDVPASRGWLVLGSSIGLVRRVADRLDAEPPGPGRVETSDREIAMHAVAVPARIAEQVVDLARLRSIGGDDSADEDASLLHRLAEMLSGFERIEWVSGVQDGERVRARIDVRRAPMSETDPEPPAATDAAAPMESP